MKQGKLFLRSFPASRPVSANNPREGRGISVTLPQVMMKSRGVTVLTSAYGGGHCGVTSLQQVQHPIRHGTCCRDARLNYKLFFKACALFPTSCPPPPPLRSVSQLGLLPSSFSSLHVQPVQSSCGSSESRDLAVRVAARIQNKSESK